MYALTWIQVLGVPDIMTALFYKFKMGQRQPEGRVTSVAKKAPCKAWDWL